MTDLPDVGTATGLEWRVAHTMARCEKKLHDWVVQQGWRAELPLYRSVKRYRGKKVEFLKPLFPGYVFLHIDPSQSRPILQHDRVARLLTPPDQAEFTAQLQSILVAAQSGLQIVPVAHYKPGARVEIVSGPLRGFQGVVERSIDHVEVILRLDFIGQSASVRIEPHEIEPVTS